MKKREQGILTVEASIVLTLMTLFVLFLFSFVRVYRAENLVSHATLQAADAMALESYLRENAVDDQADDVVFLASRITGASTLSAASFESLRSANIPALAKEKFAAALSDSESKADTILTNCGVKDGLAGIDFSSSTMDLDNDDVIVSVSYTLKLQFPIFGGTELSVTKAAKAKTFGEILFEIAAEPEDPNMGSAGGSGSYQHGSTIQITAYPNYGYKFVKWDDGNTDNPRIVPVTDAHKYIAVFEAVSFAVITEVYPNVNPAVGTVTGGGEYPYLSTANLHATASPGYHFASWSVLKHGDNVYTAASSDSPDVSQTVDQIYTYTAAFEPNTYHISVEFACEYGAPNVSATEIGNVANTGKTIAVKYGESVTLCASDAEGCKFKGWKLKGSDSFFSTGASVNVEVPIGNATYVAVYEGSPSISLSAGATEKHSMVFTATTSPSNAAVEWKFSGNQSYYTLTVSPDTHTATLTINDANIPFGDLSVDKRQESYSDHMNIYGTVYSDVSVTASIRNNGAIKDTRTVRTEPTTQVFYYMYRKNGTRTYRYYYNYELANPWDKYSRGPGYFYRVWSVKYSDLMNAKTTDAYALFNKISNSDDQHGKNMAGIPAYQILCPKELVGGYNQTVLAYLSSIKGETNGSGYYDFYFSSVIS